MVIIIIIVYPMCRVADHRDHYWLYCACYRWILLLFVYLFPFVD